ncbi:MAG: hypothetical protein CENE_02852 [Candidatus Celerinatantimonas neptuna]|nr:MAG: hypothetical protein CENE_02852 [Candidatus Celerinatantimonas neptuna]
MSELFIQTIPGILILLLIAITGWGVVWWMSRICHHKEQRNIAVSKEIEFLQGELDSARDQSYYWQNQFQQQIQQQGQWQAKAENAQRLQVDLEQLRSQLERAYQQHADLKSELARSQQKLSSREEQIESFEKTEARFKEAFENLANQIFEQKSNVFREQNQVGLNHLLQPLRQQLEHFRQQIQHSYDIELKERHSLKSQLERLHQLNQQMSDEAVNLTRALKGDNKQQGNWGEVVLSKVLEDSGLRKGYEYDIQVTGKNQQGQTIKPDVVVHLPDQRDVIVDSKVTLVAYERYCNEDSSDEQQQALQAHIRSLRSHINGLAKKNYQTLYGIQGLDFVLLFVPIEAAFQLALEHDPQLISLASRQNILLVSPGSLLVALRTIENVWRSEYQQRNVAQIAERAGRLYDKFCGFVEELMLLGNSLDKAQVSYQSAIQKLSEGRGNLIRRAEQLKDLQIPVTKHLPDSLVDAQ